MSVLDDIGNSVFKKSTGTIMGDLLGTYSGGTLLSYLNDVFDSSQPYSSVLNFFYEQLYKKFSPDINGYTLLFFVPPDLSGYRRRNGEALYGINKDSYMGEVGKIMSFAAVDFTPPQSSVRTENVTTRSGGIPIASEVSESDTCTITFIDNSFLDIYMFHHIWIEYIREILEGTIEPDPKYYMNEDSSYYSTSSEYMDDWNSEQNASSDYYGAIDYAASFYIVKYRPDMRTISFVSKCVGVFPQSMPNKELVGTRTSNELVVLPFTYSCSGYRESLYMENQTVRSSWIFNELDELVASFQTENSKGLFGGFLGEVVNKTIGPTDGVLGTLTSYSEKLQEVGTNVLTSTSKMWSSVTGVSGKNGMSQIFKVN